jgi:predicted amidophosphoribosyltransferase
VRIAALLVPCSCVACGAAAPWRLALCGRCAAALRDGAPLTGPPPPQLDAVWSAAANEGVAREVVAALKFRNLLPVAALIADRLRPGLSAGAGAAIVPVPPAPARLRGRGFDPAGEIARGLARESGVPLRACLRRESGARQVGRTRAERLARPPRFRAVARPPRRAILVDDVLTTGATLSACARALREAGAGHVFGLTFVREV